MKKNKKTVLSRIGSAALIVIGLLSAGVFLLPFYWSGIFNEGTIFGLGIATVLIICGIFGRKIASFIRRLWKAKRGRATVIAAITAIAIFCTAFTATLAFIISETKTETKGENVVIVLGCLVKPDRPSDQLQDRIRAASVYLADHPESVAILCGGQGDDEPMSEAECMKRELKKAGIDEKRLIKEDTSTSTFENLEHAKRIMDELNLGFEAAVVSSDYHVARAKIVAEMNGIKASEVSAFSDYSPVYYVREVFAVWATLAVKAFGKR